MERHVHSDFRSKSRVVGDFSVHTGKCTCTVCLDRTNPSKVQTADCLSQNLCVSLWGRASPLVPLSKHTHITVFFKPTLIMAVKVPEELKWDISWWTRGEATGCASLGQTGAYLLTDEHGWGLNDVSLCTEWVCLLKPHPVAIIQSAWMSGCIAEMVWVCVQYSSMQRVCADQRVTRSIYMSQSV